MARAGKTLIKALGAVVLTALLAAVVSNRGDAQRLAVENYAAPIEYTIIPTTPTPIIHVPPSPTPTPTPEPTPAPEPEYFTITLAGDCTIGSDRGSGAYESVVREDWSYPFANVMDYFGGDDMTFVNLETTFTTSTAAADKLFCFKADPAYVSVLTAGSVECVTTANNHTYDYGSSGYADTAAALDGAGVTYAGENETAVYTTASGLRVGLFCGSFATSAAQVSQGVAALREQGADIIMTAMHWGNEGSYHPTSDQIYIARAAIDAGADIVCGSHPHVLQPMEEYGGGYIFYSMGNWTFGGNSNPRDKDSALVRISVMRSPEGDVSLAGFELVPCRISSESSYNNYQPTPYEPGTEEYDRAMSKLQGTFTGPDLTVNYSTPAPEESAAPETEGE